MSQLLIAMDQERSSFRIPTVKLLLALLIFSPLVYSKDGDPYRAFEVVIVGILFLLIAIPNMLRLALWVRSGTVVMLAIALLIAVQPAFIAGAGLFYNLKFMVVLLFCFLPTLYLSNCHPARAAGAMVFVPKALRGLFGVSMISLIVSSMAGVGEVYTEGGALQQRAFSWLGDSFSPVMVFFLYYYAFRRNAMGFFLSAACLVAVMQAKMAIVMAALGYMVYLFLFGRRRVRLFLIAVTVLGVLFLPVIFELAVANLHNFEYSLNNRLLSFNAGLGFFSSSPWFGVGANQSFTLLSNGFDVSTLDRYDSGMPFYEFFQIHNSFLRILAELGIGGFLLFVAFCMGIVRRSYIILTSAHASPPSDARLLLMACALWLISFVLFYQTTGWFEPGNPQLSWLVCFLTLMNFSARAIDSPKAADKRPGTNLRCSELSSVGTDKGI
jgi:O-antigen ligase